MVTKVGRTAIFLSIRDKATRLPNKATLEVGGKPVIERLLTRLKTSREAELIALTTSVNPDDAHLMRRARQAGLEAFAGSEDDKLQRYLDAARAFDVAFAVIVDGDDLFCSVDHIDESIRRFRKDSADYITQEGLPLGAASFGIRIGALEWVVSTKSESDTEVWGEYFTSRSDFRVVTIKETDPVLRQPGVRMTLDYPEDLAFFRAIYDEYRGESEPTLGEVMAILHDHPQILDINREAQLRYEDNLRLRKPARFRGTQA
ncbi:MAG: cytidylyltransferase domain-containing protein [Gemmatimonadaceae bacterium]